MPSISEFYGLSVYMYNNGQEHNPPHFHVFYGDLECIIDIHKDELLQNWELATKKMDLRNIAPLV